MKKTLIFLHGGPGFSDYLKPFFQELNTEFELIFYDQLKCSDVSVDKLITQLHMLVDGKENVTLVGHSWGATLGLEFISRHPGLIDSFIFISSGLDAHGWKNDYEVELERRGISKDQSDLIYLSSSERDKWNTYLKGLWDSFSPETFDVLFENYLKDFDLREEFQNITCPMLCVFGTDDLRFPISAARKLGKLNRSVRLIEVEGAGHFPFLLGIHRSNLMGKIREFLADPSL